MSFTNLESNYETFRVSLTHPPADLSGISRQIWTKFEEHRQTHEDFRRKLSTWKRVAEIAKIAFSGDYLFLGIAGSALNGYGLKDSDLDLCLISRYTSGYRQKWLAQLKKLALFSRDSIIFLEVIPAFVPILQFKDTLNGTIGDISCDSIDNIRNTYLLYCYSQVDWRVQPLAVVLKLWAKSNEIDTIHRSLSSYALILMLIHFLQYGVKPQVLPNLQTLLPNKFHKNLDVTKSEYLSKIYVPFATQNRQSFQELLREFFLYYKNFNYQSVISVREGSVISRWQYSHMTSYQKTCVHIEEPFHLKNVAKNVTNVENIKAAADRAYTKLSIGLNLDSIFA